MSSNYINYNYRNSILFDYYYFLDTVDNYSKNIFSKNNISVKFIKKFCNNKTRYVIVECRSLKRNRVIFDKCMDELCKNMLITGHNDYEEFSQTIMRELIIYMNSSMKIRNNTVVDCTYVIDKTYVASVSIDSSQHRNYIIYPNDPRYALTEREVADKIKFNIDFTHVEYKSITIDVKPVMYGTGITFSYINDANNE